MGDYKDIFKVALKLMVILIAIPAEIMLCALTYFVIVEVLPWTK